MDAVCGVDLVMKVSASVARKLVKIERNVVLMNTLSALGVVSVLLVGTYYISLEIGTASVIEVSTENKFCTYIPFTASHISHYA